MVEIKLKEGLKDAQKAIKEALEVLTERVVNLDTLIKEIEGVVLPQGADNKKRGRKLNKPAVIYLNAGHGGLDAQGNYMTFPSDGKFYRFTDAQGRVIETAYEGVLNRQYAEMLEAKLRLAGFTVVRTYHRTSDMTNLQRANIANAHYRTLSDEMKRRCVWHSIHFNAAGVSNIGQGVSADYACYFTLNGQNQSDAIGSAVWRRFREYTQGFKIKYSEDQRDGDADHEAGFQEFNLTAMPAILFETLFFDNWENFQLAKTEVFRDAVTDAWLDGLMDYFNSF